MFGVAKQRVGRLVRYRNLYLPAAARRRPLCVVWGNCQAEPLRQLLASAPELRFTTVQVPPVQDVTGAELQRLNRLLSRTELFVTQEIRDDYRGLPTGTSQLIRQLPSGAQVIRVPVLFYEGLHPYQVYVRLRGDLSEPAPLTSYHDLRLLHAAQQGWTSKVAVKWLRGWSAPAVALQAVHARSIAALAEREQELDVTASSAIPAAGARAFHSINHPNTSLLSHVAQQVSDRVGGGQVRVPATELLDDVHSPVDGHVIEALGLSGDPVDAWVLNGQRIAIETVAERHLAYYEARPEVLAAGLRQHEARLTELGLPPHI